MPTFPNLTPYGDVRSILNNNGMVKNNFNALRAPGAEDDSAAGWEKGSVWIYAKSQYICVQNTPGNAIWKIALSGTTGPTTPDPDDPGVSVDVTKPDTPPPPVLTSTINSLTASWDEEPASIVYSELEYTEEGENPVFAQAGGNRHTVNGLNPGLKFSVRRRRVNQVGIKSNWSLPATHTVMKDTIPPAVPTGLAVVGTFGAFVVNWNRNTESDLSHYELAMGPSGNPTTVISVTPATNVMIGDQEDNITRYFRVRAVDTSDNKSGWTTHVSATTRGDTLTTITTEDLVGLVDATSFGTNIEAITLWTGTALPTTKLTTQIFWQGRVYTWNGTAYVDLVSASNLSGVIDATQFAAGIEPVTIHTGASLPTSKETTSLLWNGKLYRWNGTAYTPDVLGQDAVVAGTVAAGAINTRELVAGAVVASKLAVTDTTNLVTDDQVQDTAYWGGVTPSHVTHNPIYGVNNPVARSRGAWIISTPTDPSVGVSIFSGFIPVEPGKEYFAQATVGATGPINARPFIQWLDKGEAGAVQVGAAAPAFKTTQAFEQVTVSGVAPSAARAMRLVFNVAANGYATAGTTPHIVFAAPILRRKQGGELIVDGAITANHMTADSVTAAAIQAGAILTDKLAVGFGGNFITNSDFKAGTTGWTLGKSLAAGAESEMSVNVAGQPYAGADFPTLRIAQTGVATGGFADLRFVGIKDNTGVVGTGWPVKPDDWIEVSVQVAPFRCTTQLRIEWTTDTGTVYSAAVTQEAGSWSSTNPDSWPRIWVKGKAPAGATYARLHLRKLPTSSGADSLLFVHKPMQTISTEQRTEVTPYAPGTFTLIDGQGIITDSITARSIDVVDLAASGLTHLNIAYIKEANITGTLSAAILRSGTALTGSLTVDGTALATVGSRSADPAARINAHTTQIDPGKITVSGSTTIADWRKGGDLTKIDGGQLSVNTVTANKISIGMRGVQPIGIEFEHNKPALNRASWTAGTIEYVADDGNTATASIAAGNTTTWSSGVQYICWVKGATALTVTTSQATAVADNRVILATYEGGHKLNASYGRTIIDGNGVKTDTLLVTNNAQMGAATVNHFTIAGFAIAKMLRSNKSSWQVAGASTNVLRFTANSGEADWTSNFVTLHTISVNRLKGYHTELKVVLDQDASGSWSSRDPRSSVLQLRWQRKLSNQPAGSWVNLNLMHCNSGEFGVKTTNYLVFTDPSATSTDTGVSTMYRLLARKYNNPRFNKMNPGVSNVRCELLHYKQGI